MLIHESLLKAIHREKSKKTLRRSFDLSVQDGIKCKKPYKQTTSKGTQKDVGDEFPTATSTSTAVILIGSLVTEFRRQVRSVWDAKF